MRSGVGEGAMGWVGLGALLCPLGASVSLPGASGLS